MVLWASIDGRLEIARELIAAKADVNRADNSGRTALLWASDIEIARELIAAKADVDCADSEGFTALMLASNRGGHLFND